MDERFVGAHIWTLLDQSRGEAYPQLRQLNAFQVEVFAEFLARKMTGQSSQEVPFYLKLLLQRR